MEKKNQFRYAVITHGGASSDPNDSDGPDLAAQKGIESLKKGESALDSSVIAVKVLEDDPRFNAGTGASIRCDGYTKEFDAACMTSDGKFGAIACVENIRNPIELAQKVLSKSSHIILSGKGALAFAIKHGVGLIDSTIVDSSKDNFFKCDTVGSLVFDGKSFAASLSSGGLEESSVGRVGDVPLPGCGLFCGVIGAVACTGDGEAIALKILAKEVYNWLVEGMNPDAAVSKAVSLFEKDVDIGLIILTKDSFAAHSRHGMAWSKKIERLV